MQNVSKCDIIKLKLDWKGDIVVTLRDLRKKNKLTQDEVAKELGIHRTTLVRIEIGKSHLRAEHINILANLYNTDEKEIFELYDESRKKRQRGRNGE
ncbi:TPA: helix-turn-helix domain-containing protein [Clostridium perfringens]|uniref:helix-turn-helix domain-containing protein n=1 Tax=Clostridium perfringens TaxID=1502 RepID=UPI002468A5B3|nr:helix-turn-helix transcriptional regulator [Clostridium perfringens]